MLSGFEGDDTHILPVDTRDAEGAVIQHLTSAGGHDDRYVAHLQQDCLADGADFSGTHRILFEILAVADRFDISTLQLHRMSVVAVGFGTQNTVDGLTDTGGDGLLYDFRVPDIAVHRAGNVPLEHLCQEESTVTGSAAAGIVRAFVNDYRILRLQGQIHGLFCRIDGH